MVRSGHIVRIGLAIVLVAVGYGSTPSSALPVEPPPPNEPSAPVEPSVPGRPLGADESPAPSQPGVTGDCGRSVAGAAVLDANPLAVLPGCRVVAFYGDPRTSALGVLGRRPIALMLRSLAAQTAQWQAADREIRALCGFHLIVTSAQASPGSAGLYRAQMPLDYVKRMADLTAANGCLLFLDLQIGRSSVNAELPRLVEVLRRPHVHLALDPEWSMPDGTRPGQTIGTMDASAINVAVDVLASIVDQARAAGVEIPPKILTVHRFQADMITNPEAIRRHPDVQFVVNMDGFGTPDRKRASYRVARQGLTDAFTGFKLFYLIDKPLMGPSAVLALRPRPLFINYQ